MREVRLLCADSEWHFYLLTAACPDNRAELPLPETADKVVEMAKNHSSGAKALCILAICGTAESRALIQTTGFSSSWSRVAAA
jgi:hypothetical protein